jgi:hypothetical protein
MIHFLTHRRVSKTNEQTLMQLKRKSPVAILLMLVLMTLPQYAFGQVKAFAGQGGLCPFPSTPGTPVVSNVGSSSVTLTWIKSTNADDYTVHFTINGGEDQQAFAGDGEAIVGGLDAGSTCTFRIEAVKNCLDVDGNPFAHSSFSGSTAATLFPVTPTLKSALAATTTSIGFTWNAVQCLSYTIEVSTESTFATHVVQQPVFGTPDIVIGSLTPGTDYFYRVRANTSAGSSPFSAGSTATPTLPAIPFMNAPTNVTTNSFTANWNSTNGAATNYRLDVSTDPNFGSFLPGLQNVTVNGTSRIISNLNPGIDYFYRVRAFNNSGTSNNIGTQVRSISDQPTLIATTNISATAFNASWNAVTGAESYRIDVATDAAFTNLLTNYNNATVNGTSVNIQSLNAGTMYFLRVRTMNSSGPSVNSTPVSLITLPVPPAAADGIDINVDRFTASWNAVVGADHYLLDVSTSPDFSNLLPEYNGLVLNGTAAMVGSLQAGAFYYYRVRASNASGSSPVSNTVTVKTILPAPFTEVPLSILSTSFTARWDAASGATAYRIDVSTNASFLDFVSGYQNLAIVPTSLEVSPVSPGTTYYYRVRSENPNGVSINSNPIPVLTLPAEAAGFQVVNHQATSLTVQWAAIQSVGSYYLEVSKSQSFESLLPGYDPKVIANFTSHVLEGLDPSTIYYFRIKGINSTGVSERFAFTSGATLNADGSLPPIEISSFHFPDSYQANTSQQATISISSTGGVGTHTVKFYHKKKSEPSFTMESVTGNSFQSILQDAWFDEFGVDFYLEVVDIGGQLKREPSDPSVYHSIITKVPSFTIPLTSFGNDVSNYQVISFPYALSAKKIEDILVPVIGEYSNSSWRFVAFEGDDNQDYSTGGLRLKDVAQGKGYWFLSRNKVDLIFSDASSYANSYSDPFVMNLKQGWNQIGNPYPFDVRWSDVLSSNASGLGVGDLLVFDQQNISFNVGDVLKAYGGGFVFSERDASLTFPTSLKSISNGRTAAKENETSDEEWFVPIVLSQGNVSNSLGGVGMSRGASKGKDPFDEITPPRLTRYVDWRSANQYLHYAFSRDVVDNMDSYDWNFMLDSDKDELIEIKWNKEEVSRMTGKLVLVDDQKGIVLNMMSVDRHQAPRGSSLTISYRKKPTPEFASSVFLGLAYPNPFYDKINIPVHISDDNAMYELVVYNVNGGVVYNKILEIPSGPIVEEIQWNGITNSGQPVAPGLYLYQLKVNGQSAHVYSGKIIKK